MTLSLDIAGMIRHMADINKIEDEDLMIACFTIAVVILFIWNHEPGKTYEKTETMVKEMLAISWKRVEQCNKELVNSKDWDDELA